MPSITGLVSALSAAYAGVLVEAQRAPLADGKILFGKRNAVRPNAGPRVVFVPRGSTWGPAGDYGGVDKLSDNTSGMSAERRAQHVARSIHTDMVRFEVHVWGPPAPPDGDTAFDVTQVYVHLLLVMLEGTCFGAYALRDGDWPSQGMSASQAVEGSQEYVFGVDFATPVMDLPLAYVPAGTGQLISAEMIDPSDESVSTAFEEAYP
jgi:hypothetical protein